MSNDAPTFIVHRKVTVKGFNSPNFAPGIGDGNSVALRDIELADLDTLVIQWLSEVYEKAGHPMIPLKGR